MILQEELAQYASQTKSIPYVAEKLFVCIGATDTHYVTPKVIAALQMMNETKTIRINQGPGSAWERALDSSGNRSTHNMELLQSPEDLFEHMFWADLAICGGGNMLYECAALGLPSVSIATEPHEIHNIKYWTMAGTTRGVGWEREISATDIQRSVTRLAGDYNLRLDMVEKGRSAVDTSGLQRVVSIILEAIR